MEHNIRGARELAVILVCSIYCSGVSIIIVYCKICGVLIPFNWHVIVIRLVVESRHYRLNNAERLSAGLMIAYYVWVEEDRNFL